MGKYDDAIGGIDINLSINEVLNEDSHKKVVGKLEETRKKVEEPIKIKVDSGEMDKLLNQEKELVKNIKKLGNIKVNTKGISGLLSGDMSKGALKKTIDVLEALYEVQNKIRQESGNTKRIGSDFLSGFSSNDIKTDLIPKLQGQLSELNRLGLDNIAQLKERERLSSRLSKLTKKDFENAKLRVVDGENAESEAKAIENIVANRQKVVEEMKVSKLFNEKEIKDIERQNKGYLEQAKLLREIRVAKVKAGEKIVVQPEDAVVSEPKSKKSRGRKPKEVIPEQPQQVPNASKKADIEKEVVTFALQFSKLEKELGGGNKFAMIWNDILAEMTQGALTASEAVEKLREEISTTTTQRLTLYHNSNEIFDKFNSSKASHQGKTLGPGNYLSTKQDSKYNTLDFGRYQTQWYADIENVFDNQNDVLPSDKISSILDKYLPELKDKLDFQTKNFIKGYTAYAIKLVAQRANVPVLDIWSSLGYDAIKDKDQINVFDSSKLHRANDTVFDVKSNEFTTDKIILNNPQSNYSNTQQEIKSQEKLQEEIKKTNRIIEVQKQWLEYLDPVLNDENFKTSGKREATKQLKTRTNAMVDYRKNPEQYDAWQMYEEKVNVAQAKAYKEAERQGVAQSTLNRHHTDAVRMHDINVEKLQKEREEHAKILAEAEKELVVLQQQLRVATELENVQKRRVIGTINGKPGKFRIKKPELTTYDTESGQISMLPAIEKETQAKEKLANANENVARSQRKINEVAQGRQLNVDDIISAANEGSVPVIEAETEAIEKSGVAAEKAAESKKKLAETTKEIIATAEETSEGIKEKTPWSETRPGVDRLHSLDDYDGLDNFNLPSTYRGENGQDAIQVFSKLKGEIEELTGQPVTIDFISEVNDSGQLEAVGATLKYVNEEAGVTVKQFYDIKRNEDDILVATQSHEKATISATKAAKSFNTEMQKKLALEQIKTLEAQMGELKLDLTEVKQAANNINDSASLEHFNLSLRSAKEQAKQLKTELKGQNTLDTIASMERALLTLPSRLEEVERRLNSLGNVDGTNDIGHVLDSIKEEYEAFLNSTESQDKVKLFRSLTSSMVWVNSEMRNLSGKNNEIKRKETEVEKEELKKQKAAREAYIDWWKTTLTEQEKANKPYVNYGKTTANAAERKRDQLQGQYDTFDITTPAIEAQMDSYKQKVQEVINLRNQFANDPNAAKDPALVKQFQKVSYEAEQARKNIKSILDEEAKMKQMSEEQGFEPVQLAPDEVLNYEAAMRNLVMAHQDGRVEIKGWNADHTKLNYTVTNAKGTVQEMTVALGQGTNHMYQYRTATKETGTAFDRFMKGISTKAKEISTFILGGGSIYKIIGAVKQGIQYVREIDAALTELKKVTDETEETYDKFLDTASKTAAKVGSTIKDVVSSTADWARLNIWAPYMVTYR